MAISRRDFMCGCGVVASAAALSACAKTPGSGVGGSSGNETGTVSAESFNDAKWSFMVPPKPITDNQITETYTHDIVVIGSGISGLATAVSAAEQGADIILFSAGTVPTGRGGSIHGIGTKYQKEHGIEDSPERRRKMVLTDQAANGARVNLRMWARWINNSGKSIDWMIDKMASRGLQCSLEPPYLDVDDVISCPPSVHNFWNTDAPLGTFEGAPLIAKAYADIFTTDYGCEIHYSTHAEQLVRDDGNTGRVSAVIAKDADGNYVKYVANKAIVMATGDFSKDLDMVACYSPYAYQYFKNDITPDLDYDAQRVNSGTMPGEGQKMGLWIGAAWQKCTPNPTMISCPISGPTHCVVDSVWGINLNKNGQRYHNENTNMGYGGYALRNQPNATVYTFWDINYAYTQDSWEHLGCTVDYVNGYAPYSPAELIATWDDNAAKKIYLRADTLDKLLDQMDGIDKKAALASIQHYTKCAKAGYDDEFQVNPKLLFPIETGPFYGAVSVAPYRFQAICGGLRTNEFMQVCDAADTPIEGLYNVGVMTGDMYHGVYAYAFPGQSLGANCTTFPYLLGRDLAAL